MSPRFKGQWRASLFKLMLLIALLMATTQANKRGQEQVHHQQQSQQLDVDLMEPCYLANNRASESLTISESTPVGTVVGELLVNGDPSTHGNIELSIKMPAGNQQQPVGTQQQTNGYSAATKRLGSQVINFQQVADRQASGRATDGVGATLAEANVRSARDLSTIIDLMPPLSIEHETKRLILAKKLDREQLDRYASHQSSLASSQSSAGSGSSAALTVHVKCQLRGLPAASVADSGEPSNNRSASAQEKISATKSSSSNSILIPIHLIVTDENDNWPVFINSPYIIDLNETVPVGAPLPGNEIVAVDSDQQGPLSTIEYSIVPGSIYSDSFAFLNPLDSRSLIVKDNRLLDYESQSKLTLKVMAKDQGEPSNWAITSLYINLFDNDDLNPAFGEDRYFGQVKDNRPGEILDIQPRRLLARDADKTINAPIVYSFHTKTNHSIHFELDADLARLSLKKTLPEGQQPFCLLIRATQADDPQKWSLAAVQVRLASSRGELEQLLAVAVEGSQTVESSSANTLKFAQSNYTLEVSELAPPGFTVLNLRASFGSKSTDEAEIRYQLLDDDAGHFKLDPNTGQLTLNRSIDYELYRRVSVRILATYEYYTDDSGTRRRSKSSQSTPTNYPNLACDTTRVSVIVINQNDHKPEFSHDQYNLQLSVSDLIASFDPPKVLTSSEPMGADESSVQAQLDNSRSNKNILHRSGEVDLDDSMDEPFDWRAMQLGQVYCADRDFGDKVTLQLAGSKANLFHLTQDGRLYLPLVNTTSLNPSATSAGSTRKTDLNGWPHLSRTINNQLVPSKVFFARRQDRHPEPPDRDYLNYLLSELSNLGRLRLKVVASDDGQPQAQTSAIIVISIISIDNFIIQRALQPPKWQPAAPSGSPSPANKTQEPPNQGLQSESDNSKQLDYSSRQVMMIPATNGRSFVQVNPDIVSNLILQNNGSPTAPRVNAAGNSDARTGGRFNQQQTEQSQPATETGANFQAKFQPPSLLLVDDDGAKFVAMPAAIEVYNQQVQEAADLLQARQRNQAYLTETSKRLLRETDESLWSRWKAYIGFSKDSNSQGGFLYWINLSSAIMLHLIVLAIVITSLARLRSSISDSRSSSCGPRLSWFSHGGTGTGVSGNERPPLSAQDTHSKYSAHRLNSSDDSTGSSYTFMAHTLHQQQQHHSVKSNSSQISSDSDHSAAGSSNYLAGKTVSSGHLVSATSNGGQRSLPPPPNIDMEFAKQSNLFGHLKLTLNKMLELGDANPNSCGQVTIKALDSDSASFKSFNSETRIHDSGSGHHSLAQNNATFATDKRTLPEASKSSTFVGSQRTGSPLQVDSSAAAATIVSINVSGPKQTVDIRPSATSNRKLQRFQAVGNSSSSSVVSLVSMSSSISNKINAAVERTSELNMASDASSLDSNTLFNSNLLSCIQQEPRSRANEAAPATAPPPPPPPPPPPSLVQVGGLDSLSLQSFPTSLADQRQAGRSVKPAETNEKLAASPLSPRRPLPQNPVHVRLRQQAAAEQQQQQQQLHQVADRSHKQVAPSVPKKPPAPQPYGKIIVNKGKVSPPTPPPPPSNASTSTETVSPTTSVDRGYESFQSYTSSSQHRGADKANGSSSKDLSDCTGSNQQQQVRTQAVGSSGATVLVAGRQSQRNQRSQPKHFMGATLESLDISTKQLVKHRRLGDENLLRGRDSERVIRSSRTLALGAAATQQGIGVARGNILAPNPNQVERTKTRSHRLRSSTGPASKHAVDHEVEDEDFYFCYPQAQDTYGQRLNLQPTLTNNPILNEYVSHAYTQCPPLPAPTSTRDLMQLQKQQVALSARQAGGLDLMLAAEPHPSRGQQGPYSQRAVGHMSSQQVQQHQRQHSGSYSAANKKQLTWSDQVRIA